LVEGQKGQGETDEKREEKLEREGEESRRGKGEYVSYLYHYALHREGQGGPRREAGTGAGTGRQGEATRREVEGNIGRHNGRLVSFCAEQREGQSSVSPNNSTSSNGRSNSTYSSDTFSSTKGSNDSRKDVVLVCGKSYAPSYTTYTNSTTSTTSYHLQSSDTPSASSPSSPLTKSTNATLISLEVEESRGEVFIYSHSYPDPCFLRNISHKYMPSLCPLSSETSLASGYVRDLLVVGVQRSGTHYIWEMLNQLFIDLHHEGIGDQGRVSWLYAVNAHDSSSWKKIKTIDMHRYYVINNPARLSMHRFRYIFHQVR
jgi:hypothetical protein